MPNTNESTPINDTVFSVYAALDNLNKRLHCVEDSVPDYAEDMLEVYRNLGVLTKRLDELERKLDSITGGDRNE